MARPIIKPLKMADGMYVRASLEELRAHFDLPSVLGYYADGRLKEWLENRDCKNEAEQLSKLNPDAADFNVHLCEVFGVECLDDVNVSMGDIAARNAKLTQIKQITVSDEIIGNVDKVAFTQEEMNDLADKGTNLIYLCGEEFVIPADRDDVVYIGVNSPVVRIGEADEGNLAERKITFQGVVFDGSHITKLTRLTQFIDMPDSKTKQLRLYTNSDEIMRNIDKVAFTQDEMMDMLKKREKLIYLCGKSFKVPESIKNVTIIGINNPVIRIGNTNKDYLSSRKIVFRDVVFSGSHLNKGGK